MSPIPIGARGAQTQINILPSGPLVGPSDLTLILELQNQQTGIVAHAGGGQALAVPITANMALIATCATPGDSILLPPATPAGQDIYVFNEGASSCNVYASGTDTINAIAASSPFALAAGKTAIFCNPIAGKWYTVPQVP